MELSVVKSRKDEPWLIVSPCAWAQSAFELGKALSAMKPKLLLLDEVMAWRGTTGYGKEIDEAN